MKRTVPTGGVVIVLCLGALGAPAWARGAPAAYHVQQAMLHVDRFELRAAIAQFQRAWEADPRPSLLYKIGHLHFRLSQFEGSDHALSDRRTAVDYLERYLRAVPDAPDRDMLEERIARMKVEIRQMEAEEQRVAEERAREVEERRKMEQDKAAAQAEAERAKGEAERAKAEAERAKAEAAKAQRERDLAVEGAQRSSRHLIIGAGAASTVIGLTAIVTGGLLAWNAGELRQRLLMPDRDGNITFSASYVDLVLQNDRIAWGMIVPGAIATIAGVSLLIWKLLPAAALARAGSGNLRVTPALNGFTVEGTF